MPAGLVLLPVTRRLRIRLSVHGRRKGGIPARASTLSTAADGNNIPDRPLSTRHRPVRALAARIIPGPRGSLCARASVLRNRSQIGHRSILARRVAIVLSCDSFSAVTRASRRRRVRFSALSVAARSRMSLLDVALNGVVPILFPCLFIDARRKRISVRGQRDQRDASSHQLLRAVARSDETATTLS